MFKIVNQREDEVDDYIDWIMHVFTNISYINLIGYAYELSNQYKLYVNKCLAQWNFKSEKCIDTYVVGK